MEPIYPNYWATYWNLRTCVNPYTVDQALLYMREEDETGEWQTLTREFVRQLEMRYMMKLRNEAKANHPCNGR